MRERGMCSFVNYVSVKLLIVSLFQWREPTDTCVTDQERGLTSYSSDRREVVQRRLCLSTRVSVHCMKRKGTSRCPSASLVEEKSGRLAELAAQHMHPEVGN